MRLLILLQLLFISQLSIAQEKGTEHPDSLLTLLEQKTTPDSSHLNLLMEIGVWYKRKKEWPEAQANLYKALSIAEELQASHKVLELIDHLSRTFLKEVAVLKLIKSYDTALTQIDIFTSRDLSNSINFAAVLTFHSLYSEGLRLLFKLEQKIKGTKNEAHHLPWIWIYRGELLTYVDDFEQAKICRLKGIEYAKESKDTEVILYGSYTLGWAMVDQEKYDEALVYWRNLRQDTVLVKPKSKEYLHCTNVISDCLKNTGNYKASVQALFVGLENAPNTLDTLVIYSNLINIYGIEKNIQKTSETFNLCKKIINKNPKLSPYFNKIKITYAETLIQQEQFDSAKALILPVFEQCAPNPEQKEKQKQYISMLSILIASNKDIEAYEKVYYYQNKLLAIRDSIQNKKSSQRAIKMAAIHQESRNRVEMDSLSVQNKQQAHFLWLSGGVSLLFLSLGGVIWRQSKNLKKEKKKSEDLILNMLPRSIAKRMKAGENSIADYFDEATVVFIDMVGFTSFSSDNSPEKVLTLLNTIFSIMDQLTDKYGLEKIKTIGDCYMAVCGVPTPKEDHLERSINFCLAVFEEMKSITFMDKKIEFKIGMETGPAIAGIIGEKRFLFDLWGDTVNVASRMESNGKPGYIQTTKNVADKMEGIFDFQSEGILEIKGKGAIEIFILKG